MNISSKILFNTLNLINLKKRINYLTPKRSSTKKGVRLLKRFPYTSKLIIDGRLVFTAGNSNIHEKKHIVFFHGGGYSFEASKGHFLFMRNIIKELECFLSFMEYPLAPEYSAVEVGAWSLKSYEQLVTKYPKHSFILMGDSAGGGLALALSMLIRDKGIKQPEKIILYSPWLDIGLTNSNFIKYKKRDFILDIEKLKEIGGIYRQELEVDNPLVSPIFGNLNNLGQIAIFYGTEEIFYPDCAEISNKTQLVGTSISSFVYEKMQHDWVIFPIIEAVKALEETVLFIKKS